ncbi:bifunctional 2-polyprenyl-6-hydroxyphenol methylase/3-demethylubiquinol 3-O-methyltransferase UbiG [Comamonas sp. C11]|uniref:class I SAM-dependent methyltransferase n=1 Tax=Comamonas sp. C11 TaxID=2966554 RepID=UPI0021136E5C|nr:class I SAM-dependent methyltransferase [Comamonas sp. C11]UUC91651.1 class I SAM-dependent methyltransferase [Comamonas sp. C11]
MNFWDQQFSVEGYKYGTAPNAFLQSEAHRIAPSSKVLVPGDGEGRNSVWLAQQGHQVTALDVSSVGLQKAKALAVEGGVMVHTVLADLEDWRAESLFDAVVLTYVHLPPSLRPYAHRRLAQALRTGGVLILEAFHPLQLGRTSGGPKQADMLYTLDMLHSDFQGMLDVQLAQECETTLHEGPGHQGLAAVTRYVATRP